MEDRPLSQHEGNSNVLQGWSEWQYLFGKQLAVPVTSRFFMGPPVAYLER